MNKAILHNFSLRFSWEMCACVQVIMLLPYRIEIQKLLLERQKIQGQYQRDSCCRYVYISH